MQQIFENPIFEVGEIKRGAKEVPLSWTLVEGVDQSAIDTVRPGCGCTANFDWTSTKGVITAEYNDNSSSAGTTFSKSAVVVFKGSGDTLVDDPRTGNKTLNPTRKTVSISFRGKVL